MTKPIRLSDFDTDAPKKAKKEELLKKTKKLAQEIGLMSEMLYASKKNSVLVVLQGMDASGKDGVAKTVFAYCPALNIDAHAFKKPTEEEMAHDFLWRVHKFSPAKGFIKLFIRSHYEDILIQRVHKWIDDDRARLRMEAINRFEKLMVEDNGTTLLKFYFHISHKRQLEKLEERKIDPTKQWKFNATDFDESKLWEKYMHYYEDAFNNSEYPWHIVPSDKRWYRNYFVAKIVHESLKKLKPSFPLLSDDQKNSSR